MFFLGNASGHDIQFHLSSWMDVANQWRHGILYPRWAEWADWGFGEPRFIFYPPASWMLGAVLGFLLPWKIVPGAVIWIAMIVAGMSMWALAREWLFAPAAIAAAVFFAADPYRLVTIYYRSDFAELLGAALLPLLIWAALHVIRGERAYIFALSVIFAVEWLCNAPVGVIATYSLVLAFCAGAVRQRSGSPLFSGALAMLLGFALAAFYILPAAYEQKWVQISAAVANTYAPSRNFIFSQNNDPGFVDFNRHVSMVAVGMMVVALAACASVARRRDLRALWWVLAVLGAFSAFLLFPESGFLWLWLPKLRFMQFPWRWLDVIGIALAFFIAAVAGGFRSRIAFSLVTAFTLAGIATTATLIGRDAWWDSKDASYTQRGIDAQHGYDPTDEYAPWGTSPWDLPGEPTTDDKDAPPPPETPRVEMVDRKSGDAVRLPAKVAQVSYRQWLADHRRFVVDAKSPLRLAVRLLNYPAWQVRVDGLVVHPEYQPVTGQMVLPLDAGKHTVDIRFRRTWDRTLGDGISLLAWVAVLFYFRGFRGEEPG